ncbi:uncharacterized protein [Lolium perenne]|uniref:uncharacterized protein n=1 Tax=Lolium perenne TaxID=4522 RepID=UPI0021EA18E4|nr:uncharacterized protein LOC127295382 [Lolium perenne]
MGRSRRNRNKPSRNPAVAPPLAAPPPATVPGAVEPELLDDQNDPEYELSSDLKGDEQTLALNLELRGAFHDCRVFAKELDHAKRLISTEDLRESFSRKWIKNAGVALASLIHDIEETELKIRMKEGKPMPRPSGIRGFIALVNRIV